MIRMSYVESFVGHMGNYRIILDTKEKWIQQNGMKIQEETTKLRHHLQALRGINIGYFSNCIGK